MINKDEILQELNRIFPDIIFGFKYDKYTNMTKLWHNNIEKDFDVDFIYDISELLKKYLDTDNLDNIFIGYDFDEAENILRSHYFANLDHSDVLNWDISIEVEKIFLKHFQEFSDSICDEMIQINNHDFKIKEPIDEIKYCYGDDLYLETTIDELGRVA